MAQRSVEDLTLEQRGDLINNLFQNMFGRDVQGTVDDLGTGLGFWTNELEGPGVSLIDISTRVADGAINKDRVILDARVTLAQRITEEIVAQGAPFTRAQIEPVRDFLFEQIADETDDPLAVDVASFVAQLE